MTTWSLGALLLLLLLLLLLMLLLLLLPFLPFSYIAFDLLLLLASRNLRAAAGQLHILLDGLLRLLLPLTEKGDGQGSAKGLTPGELVPQVDRFLKVSDRQALIRNSLSRGATDGRAVGKLGTGGRLNPSQLGSPAGLPSYSDPKAVRIVTRVVVIGLGVSCSACCC